VRCLDFEVSEDKDQGQITNFELTFVEAGEEPGPSSFINTALSVLKRMESVFAEVQSAFTIGIAIIGAPAALLSSFTGWLNGLVGSLTALPLASTYSLAQLIDYARPRPPVALALAYRLYQDATRASELVALNDAPHPLFMPMQGKALAA
jgi:hypothetical protein